jgi:hypothetical protein
VTTEDTGQGIAHAWLNIFDGNWRYVATATANETGTFVTPELPTGAYKIIVGPPGGEPFNVYATQWYNGKPDFHQADVIYVHASEITTGVNPSLKRGATISGHVTAADTGAGLTRVYVVAVDTSTTASERGTYTDRSGAYTIVGLRSGSYWVYFVPSESGPSSEYASEWYDNKPHYAFADVIGVIAPHEADNIDATLSRRR